MKNVLLLSLFALMFVVEESGAGSAQSQQATPSTRPRTSAQSRPQSSGEAQWMSVSAVQVKPDMIDEWIEFVKNETIPALKKAGIKERSCWQTAQFGVAFEYVFITPIESFVQYDGEAPVRKALGEEGYRTYLTKSRRMTNAVHTYAIQSRPDLSHVGQLVTAPKLAVVNSVQIAPGRSQEFETILKTDVLPAVKKAGVSGYFVSQNMFGGDANVYTTVTLYDTFADIGKGSPIQRAMGTVAYNRFLRRTAGVVTHVERTVVRYNPELSITPALPDTR